METVVLNLSVHLNFYQENFSSVLFCSFLAAKSYQPCPQGAFPGFFFPAPPPKPGTERPGDEVEKSYILLQNNTEKYHGQSDMTGLRTNVSPRAPLRTFRERTARTEARRLYSQAKQDGVDGASQLRGKSKRKVKVKKLKVYACLLG